VNVLTTNPLPNLSSFTDPNVRLSQTFTIASLTEVDALQILEVLPRTPPPLPLEDRATNSLTLEEATTILEAQKLKLEENLGALRRSVAAIVAFPQGDYEEDGNANSIVKREAPDRANPRESLSTTEPPRKRVKHEPEVIDLSD